MRKILFFIFAFVAFTCSAQEVNDSTEALDENVVLMKEYIDDVRGNRRTEHWMAVTDSIVYRFALIYDTESGELIRKVQKDGRTREMFDRMNRDKEWILAHQEELRQQTIEAVNRWRSSPQVWMMFHVFNLIDTKVKKQCFRCDKIIHIMLNSREEDTPLHIIGLFWWLRNKYVVL